MSTQLSSKTQRRYAATTAKLAPIAQTLGGWIADWCRSVGGVASVLGPARPFPYDLATRYGAATVEAPQIVAALGIIEVVVRFDPQVPPPSLSLPGWRPRTRTWVYATVPGTDAQTAFQTFLGHMRPLFLWHCPECGQPQEATADGAICAHTVSYRRHSDSVRACRGSGQPVMVTRLALSASGRAPSATQAPATAVAVGMLPQPATGASRRTDVSFHAEGNHPAVKATITAFRDDAGTPTIVVNGDCAVHAAPWPTATRGAAARQEIADVLVMAGVKPDERFVYADIIMARLDKVTAR